ncbi:two-component regulator propeller domain-containing protein [Algoriphagus sp.]|uniref:sensor histidine kinase n=1 Tax=Algoriphagus sp. TaxID=1872435 RepID=UPI003919BE9D
MAFSLFSAYFSNSQILTPRFENISVTEGLPHNSVYSITQDLRGYMWFGTADGLCRYDGSRLIVFKYKAKHDQDIVNNFVRGKLLEDKVGNIWFCNESGIYKWNFYSETVERIRDFKREIYENSTFSSVYLDENDHIWIFNPLHGIFEYIILDDKIKRYPLPEPIDFPIGVHSYVNADLGGNIWIRFGKNQDPYLVFNQKSKKYTVQLTNDSPQAIFFEDDFIINAYEEKLIYISTKDNSTKTIRKKIEGEKISFSSYDAVRDNYGRLWMSTQGKGIFSYEEEKGIFSEFKHDNSKINSLPFNLTTCLFLDSNENLWIGMDGGGAAKLDLKQPKFNLFPLSEGDYPILSDYFTKCLYEDDEGRIWFGTQSNGLNILNPETKKLSSYQYEKNNSKSIPGNMVGAIVKDREGSMWIGSSGGVSIFNEADNSFETIPIKDLPPLYPLINNLVHKILPLDNGDLLVATTIGLIKIVKKSNGKYQGQYFKNTAALNSFTTDVVEMPDHSIFTAIPGGGLYNFQSKNDGYEFTNSYLEGIDLRSVTLDIEDKDYLWLGTGIGLVHFNTVSKAHQIWDEDNGLGNNYVYGSLQDSNGNLWISSNKGLSFLNRKENLFENYSFHDGLQSNEFNTQAFYKGPTGLFYFGGIKGFNWFDPESPKQELGRPVAAIPKIDINEQVFLKDEAFVNNPIIRVNHDHNDFNFQFAALDFTRPEASHFQYILEGWDENWITTENRSARYSNLSPGNYTLKLIAFNSSGIRSAEEKIYLIINPPFWEKTEFMFFVIVLFLIGIVLITYKISQLKAEKIFRALEKQIAIDAERNRISADMHDEIGSGITHIALLSELMLIQSKPFLELKKDIQFISYSARTLLTNISEIIWALNSQNDSLENLLAYIREQSCNYFDSLAINLEIEFPDEIPDIKLSNLQRRNLYLVSREALNNAIKHSNASSIKLELEIDDNTNFCFSVTDNGKGMIHMVKKSGNNGILNMIKRMEDIGGTIAWEPMVIGTKVKFCLLLET